MPTIRDLMQQEEEPVAPEEEVMAQPMEEEEDIPPGMEPATPEENEEYERVILAASEILYDEKTSKDVVKMLTSGDDPVRSITTVAVMIMLQLDEQAQGQISETVILPAAMEVVELTSELAQKNGMPVDEAVMNQAAHATIIQLAKEYGVEDADIEEMMASFAPEQIEGYRAQHAAYEEAGGMNAGPNREIS